MLALNAIPTLQLLGDSRRREKPQAKGFDKIKKPRSGGAFSVGFQLLLATKGAVMIVLARRTRYAAAQERTRSRAYGDADREPRLKCKSVISLPT